MMEKHLSAVLHHLFRAGLLGQGLRFILAGAASATVFFLTVTMLAVVVGWPFQVALIIGYACTFVTHFTLQRFFVWPHREKAQREREYALALHRQVGWYLLAGATQYGVVAVSTALLPPVLGLSTEAVFLIVSPVVASTNFLLYRSGIFRPRLAATASCLPIAEGK
jgi:putative flippase GtrA